MENNEAEEGWTVRAEYVAPAGVVRYLYETGSKARNTQVPLT